MAGCSQAQWNYYVSLKQTDWIYLSNTSSPGYDSILTAAIEYARQNKLFGFDPSIGGSNAPIACYGSVPIVSGPIKS